MQAAGFHIDQLAARLVARGVTQIALWADLRQRSTTGSLQLLALAWLRPSATPSTELSRWHVPKQTRHKRGQRKSGQQRWAITNCRRKCERHRRPSVARRCCWPTRLGSGRPVPAHSPAGRCDVRTGQFRPRGDIRQALDRAIPRDPGRSGGSQHCIGLSPVSLLEGSTPSRHLPVRTQRRPCRIYQNGAGRRRSDGIHCQ